MDAQDLKSIVRNIVAQANILKCKFVDDPAPINYACIFSQSDEGFNSLLAITKQMGKVVKETPAGPIFQIGPLSTAAGNLQLLKIRKPDPTRSEWGDADFTLSNYDEFKKAHLGQKGFTLINKEYFEMIELVDSGFTVRVYFSNPPLDKQLGIV